MSKVQITKVDVFNLEYKGKRTSTLEPKCNYVAVVTEGTSAEGSIIRLDFQNGHCEMVIYDSFIAFANDWDVLRPYNFPKAEIPPKPGN